jgi:uncharacterized membrane protein
VSEDDELSQPLPDVAGPKEPEDNSLGRLLTLSDGIFAIAMTLLALDLSVPMLAGHPTDAKLRHKLAENADSYWTFLLTFYVVGGYWGRHRRLMRSAVATHPALIRDTMFLLVLVAAMPFPASLLGRYGGEPISLAIYGAFNALATFAIIVMSWDVRRLHLAERPAVGDEDYAHSWASWLSLVVFLLCLPAGYVFGRHGPYVLLLLAVPARVVWLRKIGDRVFGSRRRADASGESREVEQLAARHDEVADGDQRGDPAASRGDDLQE